jgi:xylulose-5-phosphate/fructose-6-phosphate phosphoketolase
VPALKIRVVNVIDLMSLQPQTQHPHGLSDAVFDEIFTKTKPIVFAFHGYPLLIHRLTYRRTNHSNLHVHGYQEEGTTTTPFDMTVLNELDRFHLATDAVRRAGFADSARHAVEEWGAKLAAHSRYIREHGEDMPEIRDWKWNTSRGEPA